MGAFALLAFVAIALIGGEIARHQVITKGMFPVAHDVTGPSMAFLAYKQAVQHYVFDNPGTSGSLPSNVLDLDSMTLASIAPGNQIIRTTNGTQIVTWTAGAPGLLAGILQNGVGDAAIGTSSGTRWSTPALGDMGALPITVPAGDIVSVVTFTGTGYSQ